MIKDLLPSYPLAKVVCMPSRIAFVSFLTVQLFLLSANRAAEPRKISMPEAATLSPDGAQICFSWINEIWSADIDGGNIRRLTNNAAVDSQPLYSPDGKQIAFISSRTGSNQIYLMKTDGSELQQVTFHSEGYSLEDWFPDGKSLLATGDRDHFHRDATRLIRVDLTQRRAERVLSNAMAEDPKVSPDGKHILFTREGERWWRKGYQGERASQVWMLELETGEFQEVLHEGVECMWPVWMHNGKGFYFTKGAEHGFDLFRYRFAADNNANTGKQKKIVGFDEDSIVYPSISRDGSTILFRHLFDLYSFRPAQDKQPIKIELSLDADVELPDEQLRREFSSADEIAFSSDGLEVALIAGGDVWIMDTKLKEPVRVTQTDGYESDLVFSNDGEELWFTSVVDGKTDIWKATRGDTKKYWWQNTAFNLEQITDDAHVESRLQFTPDSQQLLFQQGRGNLVSMTLETRQTRTVVKGFSGVRADISPDSRWIAYSHQDNDFNSEIWIASLVSDHQPVNVSRHPDNDSDPVFSTDGKILAFTGRRVDEEVDIYYVYLQEGLDEETSRQRLLDEALELMRKKRNPQAKSAANAPKSEIAATTEPGDQKSEPAGVKPTEEKSQGDKEEEETKDKKPAQLVEIDLDRIHERLRRISIPDSFEGGLLFSPDGKKLAFNASVDGKRGWYTVEFPDQLSPKLLTTSTGSQAKWPEKAGGILYLRNGEPAKVDPNGKTETYSFRIAQQQSRAGWLKSGFEAAWLVMREVWYDERFANRNWDEVRRKYAPAAAQAMGPSGLAAVIQLMLGELNGSHLGFSPTSEDRSRANEGWNDITPHLGVRFEEKHNGPGLLVRDVIVDGPADRENSKLLVGDVVLAIDGTPVDPAMDLTQILNGRLDRDIALRVERTAKDHEKKEIEIALRPISYSAARTLLYDSWLEHNRRLVDKSSGGRLGYLHIRAMDMGSFYEFERQLYNVGYGREGLVIDVRDNGGGSTTDLLLTALTQPKHAITIPRGGGQGYPHDRAVFASWSKPIIVLCNQNSYSNAEIFSHAIKSLGRGKVVGVQTAGGVVSTGSARVNDVGNIRVPFRGWFVIGSGEDMEMNGCVPDEVLWPLPGELPQGVDRQLEKAIELLLKDVSEVKPTPQPKYATER